MLPGVPVRSLARKPRFPHAIQPKKENKKYKAKINLKRHLLLERKVMTNLDSILKSRDVTFPTKFRLVKAMVFPVVMYGCESWSLRKVEHQRIGDSELWCWRGILRQSLGVQGDPTSQS